jgi:hypothetical protein
MATDIKAAWTNNQLITCGNSSSIDTLAVTPLDGTSATLSSATGSSGKWAGSQTGDITPAVAVLIKLTTATRGRSRRGRVYLPFTSENVVSSGQVLATTVATMMVAWDAFIAALTGSAIEWGVASYKEAAYHTLALATGELSAGTQRRRQTRVRS